MNFITMCLKDVNSEEVKEFRVDNWQIDTGQGGKMQASRRQGIIRIGRCVSLEQVACRSSESSPVTDTVLEDVLEESATQQVSSLSIST